MLGPLGFRVQGLGFGATNTAVRREFDLLVLCQTFT